MNKTEKVAAEREKAAEKLDRQSTPARELGSHHLTKANAILRGDPVPEKTAKALKNG